MAEQDKRELQRYRYILEDFLDGDSTARQVAFEIIDRAALRSDFTLFPNVLDMCPEPIRAEIVSCLAELSTGGYNRTVGLIGATLTPDEMALHNQRLRENYSRLASVVRQRSA